MNLSDMQITFHIGAPRSGSSAIQKALCKRCDAEPDFTFERIRQKRSALSLHLSYLHHYPNSRMLGNLLAGYTNLLMNGRRLTSQRRIVLSEENLAGLMLGKHPQLYSKSDLFFPMVRTLAKKNDCHVVAFVRRMDQYIESCYKFQLQRAESRTISEFVESIDFDHLAWSKLLDHADNYGLSSRIHLIEFDSYFKNHDHFDHVSLPLGFEKPLFLEHTNHSATNPLLLSFMRRACLLKKKSIYRSGELQAELSRHPEPDTLDILLKTLGNHSWVHECYHQAKQHSEDGQFPDVIMSNALRQQIQKQLHSDTLRLRASDRCRGNFDHW